MYIDIRALIFALILSSPLLFLLTEHYQNIEDFEESMIVVHREVNKAIKINSTDIEKVEIINTYCTAYSVNINWCIGDLRREMFAVKKE